MIITGWWYTYPSEKYELVSWDYYSQYMESHNPFMFQTTKQFLSKDPNMCGFIILLAYFLSMEPIACHLDTAPAKFREGVTVAQTATANTWGNQW